MPQGGGEWEGELFVILQSYSRQRGRTAGALRQGQAIPQIRAVQGCSALRSGVVHSADDHRGVDCGGISPIAAECHLLAPDDPLLNLRGGQKVVSRPDNTATGGVRRPGTPHTTRSHGRARPLGVCEALQNDGYSSRRASPTGAFTPSSYKPGIPRSETNRREHQRCWRLSGRPINTARFASLPRVAQPRGEPRRPLRRTGRFGFSPRSPYIPNPRGNRPEPC
jgi:hypothetical protein